MISTDSIGSLLTASRTRTWTATSSDSGVVVVVEAVELDGVVVGKSVVVRVVVNAEDELGCVVVVVGKYVVGMSVVEKSPVDKVSEVSAVGESDVLDSIDVAVVVTSVAGEVSPTVEVSELD